MALQQTLTPYLRTLSVAKNNVRTFAAAAKAKEASSGGDSALKPREAVKVSEADGVTVASIETNKPISKLAVFFRAGSRFETDQTQGAAHMIRIAAGLGTSGASQFGLTRSIEQAGGNLYCTGGREHIAYVLESTRNQMSSVDRFLQDVAVNQVFKPWELSDNLPRLRLERAQRSPEVRIMELIHKCVYRKGLGYSLYSPKWMIGNHSSEMLNEFVNSNFGKACVVGVGLPHKQVAEFASRLNLKGSPGTPGAGKFHAGSELRKETNHALAYVAIATQGAGVKDPKGHVASALAQRILGAGARVKRGVNAGGKLHGAVTTGKESQIAATAFSASYADSGILGVYVATTPAHIGEATKKAADVLRKAKITDEDLARAKNMLKTDVALTFETESGCLEELGLLTLLTGKIATIEESNALIDSVTAAHVSGLLNGKLSMASFGNVANVPHIDEL